MSDAFDEFEQMINKMNLSASTLGARAEYF
jgi:hypothetical protein